MNRVVRIILLAFIFTTTLSSCLVEKKDLVQIARTTDNLRVYQAADTISYNVTATTVSDLGGTISTQTGTLTVQWNLHANLIRPVSLESIPVIQEVSTLNLGGITNEGTVRYISQEGLLDPNPGQITLHALEVPGTDTHYWLNTNGDAELSTTEFFTTFNSPISFGDQNFDSYNPSTAITTPNTNINFSVLKDCEGKASCDSAVGRFIDDHNVVGDSVSVTTNLGVFVNPFQINFSGSATPAPATTSPIIFDIRNICDTDSTQHGYAGNGRMYVMPEIGMIRMENTCRKIFSNESVYYTITISSTNIPLP